MRAKQVAQPDDDAACNGGELDLKCSRVQEYIQTARHAESAHGVKLRRVFSKYLGVFIVETSGR